MPAGGAVDVDLPEHDITQGADMTAASWCVCVEGTAEPPVHDNRTRPKPTNSETAGPGLHDLGGTRRIGPSGGDGGRPPLGDRLPRPARRAVRGVGSALLIRWVIHIGRLAAWAHSGGVELDRPR